MPICTAIHTAFCQEALYPPHSKSVRKLGPDFGNPVLAPAANDRDGSESDFPEVLAGSDVRTLCIRRKHASQRRRHRSAVWQGPYGAGSSTRRSFRSLSRRKLHRVSIGRLPGSLLPSQPIYRRHSSRTLDVGGCLSRQVHFQTGRQAEMKGGAGARFRLRPYFPAVPFHDFARN